jgi:hypothetical protein
MKREAWLSLAFGFAAMAAQACTSTAGPPPPGEDAGNSAVDGGSVMNPGMDSSMCDGSLPLVGTGPEANCTACRVMNCASESALCAADCACGPVAACLETSFNYDPGPCPNANNAAFSSTPYMNLVRCLDMNCLMPCFNNARITDSGPAVDSATAGDSSAVEAGVGEAGEAGH